MDGEKRLRVYNRCKHDIGVSLTNGLSYNIRPGSFQLLSVNDILYVESICSNDKFFSQKKLIAVDDNGNELTLEQLGGYPDETVTQHLNDNEIIAMLKRPVKAIEAWLTDIDDAEELHAIFMVAKDMDLPASKLKALKAKIPNKDWLSEE